MLKYIMYCCMQLDAAAVLLHVIENYNLGNTKNKTDKNLPGNCPEPGVVRLMRTIQKIIKRLFDVAGSFLLLVVLFPFMLAICIANLIEKDTSVFFSHERRGKGGKPFIIYKFQTMRNYTPNCATAELEHPEQYITPVGAILRKTSLDELPQLFNILRGDMSFVGPRPLISSEMRAHRLRLEGGVYEFRPGLTGLAQINGRDDLNVVKKVRLDREYVAHFSLWLDLKILLKSVKVVVFRDGYQEGMHHRR